MDRVFLIAIDHVFGQTDKLYTKLSDWKQKQVGWPKAFGGTWGLLPKRYAGLYLCINECTKF